MKFKSRIKFILSKFSNPKSIIFLAILLLAFGLRFKNYADFPIYGETQDEVAWTWLGTSLLSGQPPTAWSGTNVKGYSLDYDLYFGQTKFRIVSPYLDNPYLFSLLPGSVALLKGYRGMVLPSLSVIRFPMLLVGVFNVALLMLLVSKLFGEKLSYLAGLLYATIPTLVFASRLVVAENLLITVMLAALVLVAGQNKISPNLAVVIGIISGLGILTKVAGLVIPLALWLYFYHQRQTKTAWLILAIALLIGSLYPLYGLLVSPSLFLAVMKVQSNLSIGLAGLFHFFIYPRLVQKTLMDGWIYLGLGSLFYYLFCQKNRLDPIAAMIIGWLGFLVVATPEVIGNGWYLYPLFPLMIIALLPVISALKNSFIFSPLFSLIVLLPTLRLLFLDLNWQFSRLTTKIILALIFLPLLIRPHHPINKKLNLLLLTLALTANCLVIYYFNRVVYWEDSLHFYPIRTGE